MGNGDRKMQCLLCHVLTWHHPILHCGVVVYFSTYMILGNKQIVRGASYSLSVRVGESCHVHARVNVKDGWDQPWDTIAESSMDFAASDSPFTMELEVYVYS